MNILTIGTTDTKGGAARVSQNIRSALTNAGHTVSMFVADKTSTDPDIHVIPRPKWRKILGFLLSSESIVDTDWIMKTDEYKSADIIHCHNLHGRYFNLKTLQKMSLAKPVVWTLHDEWAITPHCACTLEAQEMKHGLFVCPGLDAPPRMLWNNSRSLAARKINLYRQSKLHVVTPSRWLFDRVKKTALGEQDIRHIPNGIDTSVFIQSDKRTARATLGLPQDKNIVLFFANDAKRNPWKGWEYAERIIQTSTDDTLFLCVGNAVSYTDSANVMYVGEIRDAERSALYYSAADCLLFPSIAENFPLVVLEAMACGLPIVAFDVGGVKEVLTHQENGYVARYRDTEDLRAGLLWINALSAEDRTQMANASIKKIRQSFDVHSMTNAYLHLFQELL